MLIANVQRSWPKVQRGETTPAESVLGDWAVLAEAKIHQYGDAIIGVADGRIVAVYDIDTWERLDNDRVRFEGPPSTRWAHLIGTPSPVTWTRGQARPIRYFETAALPNASNSSSASGDQRDRVHLAGWTLQLTQDGAGVLHIPAGAHVTIITTRPEELT